MVLSQSELIFEKRKYETGIPFPIDPSQKTENSTTPEDQ
jgi:hypothetical protein